MEGVSEAVELLWPGQVATVTELGGGITNRNYRVDVGGEAFVLRIGGAKTSLLGIDRAVEAEAGRRAFEVGVGPEVVSFDPERGWLVCRFVDGRPVSLEEMREPVVLARAAGALRAFHTAAAIPGRFDAWDVAQDYRDKAIAAGVDVPAEFDGAWEVAERIRNARREQPAIPCHNDLLNANFLDDGSPPSASPTPPHEWGGVRIVDWEYAGMGDRFFDLANFSVNHEFAVDDDVRFLAAYFGEARDDDLASLRLMRYMSDFREAMWGVLQSGISDLDFDFRAYASKHFARMAATAADPDFAVYLNTLGT